MNRHYLPFTLFVLLAVTLAVVGGCAKAQPQRTLPVSNQGYKLDELFTDSKGYTVYRFYDQGDYRYYVVGPNGAQMLPTTKTVSESIPSSDTVIIVKDSDHGHRK
jgi:hypothetical protein